MRYSFIVLSVMLALSTSVVAQSAKGLGKSDPEAKKILDAVSAKFKTFKSVKANFSLAIENASGKNQGTKTGNVQMKGAKYKVTLNGQEIFCDGKTIWTLDKAANEVQITTLDNSSGSITPQKLFTNFYDKDFLYMLNEEKQVGSKTVQVVELTPVDKSKPFFKVLVEVDKAAKTLMSTKVFEKNGNRYIYSVSAMNTSGDIADNVFLFDAKKFPGVEIIDLR